MVMVLRTFTNQIQALGFLLLILAQIRPLLKPWLLVLRSLSIITLLRSIRPLDLLDPLDPPVLLDPQDPLDLQVQMEQTALMELLVELLDLLDLLDLPDLPDLLG
jgi:hypothetical protein